MIISESSDKEDIKFFPDSITDGMKVGIIIEKLKKAGIPIKKSFKDTDKIVSISISKKDLVGLLT